MTRGKKIFLLGLLLALPVSSFASAAQEDHSSGLMDFVGKTLNFLILFGGLAFVLRKPLQKFFDKRSRDIRETIGNAAASRKEAEAKLSLAKVRLAGLEEEVAKLKKEAEEMGLREKERIAEVAKQEAERIRRMTKLEIDMQVKAAVRGLKAHTIELATAMAQERIRKRLTSEGHSRFIDKSIERLVGFNEKSNPGQKIHPGTG